MTATDPFFPAFESEGALPAPETDPQFYAGVPAKRLLAYCVDFVLIGLLSLAFCIATLGLGFFILGLVLIAVGFAYRAISLRSRSATPGMRLMGIELRRFDGARLTTGDAIIHVALFYLVVSTVILLLIGAIMIAGSRMGRGLHDLPLGTTAINSPA